MFKKINHIGIVVKSLEEAIPIYSKGLGIAPEKVAEIKDVQLKVAVLTYVKAKKEALKPTEFQREAGTLDPQEQSKALRLRFGLDPKPVLPTFQDGAWVDPNKLSYTPVPEAQNFQLGKAAAGASKQMTLVNAYAPASEEAQKDFMKELRTSYAALRNAGSALENIEAAKKLVPAASGFMAPGGETLLNAAKFLNNRIGTNISTEGVKSGEELRFRVFFNIMDNLKKMDAQPSELQQKIMMEALSNLGLPARSPSAGSWCRL